MLVGALVPFHDTGGDPDTVREYAQALEAAGYDLLEGRRHTYDILSQTWMLAKCTISPNELPEREGIEHMR